MTERVVVTSTPEGWTAQSLFPYDHPKYATCPGCGENASREALVNLAYVYAACDCDVAPYSHLFEQLWHLRCLRGMDEVAA